MTAPRPRDLSASVRQRLLNRSQESNVDFQIILAQFGFERLLYRLSQSEHAGQFTIKGAQMFLVWTHEHYRPTRDLDLTSSRQLSTDELKTMFQGICSLSVEEDGLVFQPASVKVAPIREDSEYGGMRVTMQARLGQARIPLQVDVGFGDAITPRAKIEEFPALLEFPAPRLPMYPRESAVSEKYETMVRRGMANSRMKDYYDVWALANKSDFDGEVLKDAIRATFRRRKTILPEEVPTGLSDEFAGDETKRTQWGAFVRRTPLKLPSDDLKAVVAGLRAFLVPPSVAAGRSEKFDRTWLKGGPWR